MALELSHLLLFKCDAESSLKNFVCFSVQALSAIATESV